MPTDAAFLLPVDARKGAGPLFPALSDQQRPLRLQVFVRIRAAGLIARVQLARDLGISPASVGLVMNHRLFGVRIGWGWSWATPKLRWTVRCAAADSVAAWRPM